MEAYKNMKFTYKKLFNKLSENGLTQADFKKNANISSGTIASLTKDKSVTLDTICKICDYFHCMPDEIMEWIPDADYEEKQAAREAKKADIEAQMAELKKQLSQI